MPTPVVLATAESSTNTAGTTHTVNLPFSASSPSSRFVGATLIICLNFGSTSSSMNALTGWNELVDEGVANGMYVAWRKVDGTEGTTTAFTSSGSTRSAEIVYLIGGATDPAVIAPTISTVVTGTSTAPESGSVTVPSNSNQSEFLIISTAGMAGEEADDDTWANTAPSGYTGLLQKSCGTVGTNLGGLVMAATRVVNKTTEDPGAFNVDVSAAWRGFSIALAGALVDTPVVPKEDAFLLLGAGGMRKFVKYSPQVVPAVVQTLAVDGSITPTGALINAVTKRVGGGFTPSGVLVKAVSKFLSGSITPTGTLIKAVGKILSGSITPTGAITKTAGKVLSGAITPAGTMINAVGKVLGGGFTPAGAIAKGVGKILGGGITPSGVLSAIRVAVASLSGSITPSGAVSKDVSAVRDGTTTPTGTVIDNVTKTMTGSVTPSGSITKAVSKFFSGVITPAGSLANVILKTVALAGTITPSGAVSKDVSAVRSGSTGPTGTVIDNVTKTLTGSFTPTGAPKKDVGKVLSGSITPTGTLTTLTIILYNVFLDGAITPAGTLVKSVGKALGGTVTPTGTLVKAVGQFLGGTLTSSAVLIKTVGKFLTGAFTPSGDLDADRVVHLLLDGVIAPIGSLVKGVGKVLSGQVLPDGAIKKDVFKFLAGTINPIGIIILGGSAIQHPGSVFGGLLNRFRGSSGDREGPESTSSGDRPHSYASGGDRRFDD